MPTPADSAVDAAPVTPAPAESLDALIGYIRRCYEPSAPTRRLLAAFEAQQAELERLRAQVAGPRVPRFDDDDRLTIKRLS